MIKSKTKKVEQKVALPSELKKRASGVRKRVKTVKQQLSSEDILELAKKTLDDGKATDITVIELKGKTNIADYMLVASGSSQRQVVALAEKVALDLKEKGVRSSIEGKTGGEWVIVDALDVIIHVFYPETRAFYSLEDMWKALPKVAE